MDRGEGKKSMNADKSVRQLQRERGRLCKGSAKLWLCYKYGVFSLSTSNESDSLNRELISH